MSALSKVAKMLAKAADKGLDVSPQARKARAVEQGYLTNKDLVKMIQKNSRDEFYALDPAIKERIAYQNLGPDFDEEFLSEPAMFFHGTAGDISAFNPNMLGRSTKAASANHATFLTNLIDDADEYAKIAYENQPKRHRALELFGMLNDEMGNSQKFIERFNRYNMSEYGMNSEAVEAAQRRIERLKDRMEFLTPGIEEQGAAVYPSYLRVENPLFIDKRGEGYGDITKSLSRAKQQGNDSVIFFDITDPNPGATHAAIFDPSRIRSIHAMFDPERINSRDLLASMAGLGGIGLTDEMLDEQEPEEYASGGLVKAGKKVVESIIKNGVEFIKNPTKKEIKQLIQEDPYASARVMRDEEGNVYAFHGNEMLHDEAAKLFNVPYDIENPLENSDVIGLYKGKLHALSAPYEDIPHDEWEEWNRRALDMFNLKPAIALGAGLPALQQYDSLSYPYD